MSPDLLPVVALTVAVATAATLLLAVPAVLTAWVLANGTFRGRALLDTTVNLPLVLPPTTVGLALLLLLSRDAPLGRALDAIGIEVAFTPLGAVVASAVVAFPLVVRGVRSSFEELDPRMVGLARSLGASRWRALVDIEIPLAWRGLGAGCVLGFARALGEFGATILIAGNIPGRTQTLALAIFQRIQVGDERAALELAGISALLAFACLLVAERLSARRRRKLDDGEGAR